MLALLCCTREDRRTDAMSLYVFISDQSEEHAELTDRFGTFTDVRPSRPKLAMRQVALVSFTGGDIDAVGRITRREQKVASFKWGVRLDELIELDEPLPLKTLLRALPAPTRAFVRAAFERPGAQLNDNLAAVVLGAITQ